LIWTAFRQGSLKNFVQKTRSCKFVVQDLIPNYPRKHRMTPKPLKNYPGLCVRKPRDFTRLSQDIQNKKLTKIEFKPLFHLKGESPYPENSYIIYENLCSSVVYAYFGIITHILP